MQRITIAKGDGIGPEIMDATLEIIKAAGAQLEFDEIEVASCAFANPFRVAPLVVTEVAGCVCAVGGMGIVEIETVAVHDPPEAVVVTLTREMVEAPTPTI